MKRDTNEKDLVCILGGKLGNGNLGVNALAISALDILQRVNPVNRFVFLDFSDKEIHKNVELPFNNIDIPVSILKFKITRATFSKNIVILLFAAILYRTIPVKLIRIWILNNFNALEILISSKTIVSIAGGDSFSDIYGYKRYFSIALPIMLTIILGKKCIHMPQTIGPFKSELAKITAKYILLDSKHIFCRDLASIDYIKALYKSTQINSKISFCYDMAFRLPVKKTKFEVYFKNNKKSFGLNISGLLMRGGYNGNNMFGLSIAYNVFIMNFIEYLITKFDCNIILIPHVFGTKSSKESDQYACEMIYDKFYTNSHVKYIKEKFNQSEIKYIIKQCDFFAGSRMHSCIAAWSQGVPAIGIAYSRKFWGLMQTISMDNYIIDLKNPESISSYRSVIDNMIENADVLRDQLSYKMEHIKSDIFVKLQSQLIDKF